MLENISGFCDVDLMPNMIVVEVRKKPEERGDHERQRIAVKFAAAATALRAKGQR